MPLSGAMLVLQAAKSDMLLNRSWEVPPHDLSLVILCRNVCGPRMKEATSYERAARPERTTKLLVQEQSCTISSLVRFTKISTSLMVSPVY